MGNGDAPPGGDARKRAPVGAPQGWTVESASGFGPFTTLVEFRSADGTKRVWRSRDHRKGLGRHAVPARTWWIAVLFCVGSTCFTVRPLPAYEDLVGGNWVGITFFVGSIFFTSASYLCFLEAANAPETANTPAVGSGCRRSPATGAAVGAVAATVDRLVVHRHPVGRHPLLQRDDVPGPTRWLGRRPGQPTRLATRCNRFDLLPGGELPGLGGGVPLGWPAPCA
ncbi:MAG: hypothetical protein M5U19_19550 [Microthrixaceae bacterium]|nr:hypothetical protein [Microthrixaceae bacterium]